MTGEDSFSINGKEIKVVSSRDPTKLPWGAMNIDLVRPAWLSFSYLFGSTRALSRRGLLDLQPTGRRALLPAPPPVCPDRPAVERRRSMRVAACCCTSHTALANPNPILFGCLQVIEGTGVFIDEAGAGKHIEAGAKKVRRCTRCSALCYRCLQLRCFTLVPTLLPALLTPVLPLSLLPPLRC